MKPWILLLTRIRSKLIVAIVAGAIGGLCSAALLAAIADALNARDSTGSSRAWIYFLLCVLMVVGRTGSALLVMHVGQTVILELRAHLCRQILGAPFRKLQTIGTPRLLANLTDDVATIAAAFETAPWICVNVAIIFGCLAYLGSRSTSLFLVVVSILSIGILSFRALKGRALKALSVARAFNDALYRHFQTLTNGIKELKLSRIRREQLLVGAIGPTSQEYRKHYALGTTLAILAAHWGVALFYLTIGVILFVLPLETDGRAEPATGYVLMILYMSAPVSALLDAMPTLGRARIAFSRIEYLEGELEQTSMEERNQDGVAPPIRPARIELIDVRHRYRADSDDDDFVLGPLSLVLRPGELVFVIGGNGSGKSTLAMILVGLYAPESGEIRLDGDLVTDVNRGRYREHFSAVFSDCHIFEGVPEFGRRERDEEGRHFLTSLQLDHKVKLENGLFSTVDLSAGQRKRLALLSAYLEDRPFYVFDEWAAEQDPAFRKVFYVKLLPDLKARGKTVVVITHDDQYYHLADRCIRLERGKQ
jgi:putative ATP-binding cassette transporter